MPEAAISSTLCPLCRGEKGALIKAYSGESKLFRNMAIIQCAGCGLAYASPLPEEARLKEYNAAYFEHAHGGQESNREAVRLSSALAQLRLGHTERYLAHRSISIESVLEVGPGQGYFYQQLVNRFPGTEYLAVESDRSCQAALRQRGAQVFPTFESVPAAYAAHFTLAFASHVLEHTADPVAFVGELARYLRPGGAIFIEVPCRDFEFKERHEPHLLFFDKRPLVELLHNAGFADIEVSYHGKPIRKLRNRSFLGRYLGSRLARVARKLVPAAPELHLIEDRYEREIVTPFEAHLIRQEPSWWLRALARRPAR